MLTLRFSRRFCMAHRLHHGDSKRCATPHGHNEIVHVDIQGEAKRLDGRANMVAEFSLVKTRWHRFVDERLDHGLQLAHDDPFLDWVDASQPQWRVVVTPGDPTTELMAALLMTKCQALLDLDCPGLRCVRLELCETPTNTVVFDGDPGSVLPAHEGWWTRSDDSTR